MTDTEHAYLIRMASGVTLKVACYSGANGRHCMVGLGKESSRATPEELREVQRGIDRILDDQEQ